MSAGRGSRRRAPARPPGRGCRALAVAGAGVAVLVGVLLVVSSRDGGGEGPAPPPPGVTVFEGLTNEHVSGEVDYPQNPPVGGPHAPVWQNCGVYSSPVPEETAVHSMEHGAVWLTYRPGLSRSQVRDLEELAEGRGHVLVSPYPGLPAPVVASAWERQLVVADAEDPRLERFVDAFERGPHSPEPGAPCRGGVGTPRR